MTDTYYMEQHLTPLETFILALRFGGRSLEEVATLTESDRRVVRLREATAMTTLRAEGFTDREIRRNFENRVDSPTWIG